MDQVVFPLKGFDMVVAPREREIVLAPGRSVNEVFFPLHPCKISERTDELASLDGGDPIKFQRVIYELNKAQVPFWISMCNLKIFSLKSGKLAELSEYEASIIAEDIFAISNGKPLGLFGISPESRNLSLAKQI